jgi:hypothetical protein
MEVANADCIVLIGMLIAWRWLAAGHDDRAALLIAFLASLKLTPLFFVWWLLITGRRRAAGVAVACGAALALVAMLGSEPLIMVKFYQVMTANLNVPTISSVGPVGLAISAGMPGVVVTWLPRAILVTGLAAMWLARRRPGLSFAIGAALMWVGSPIASLHTPALVLMAFAPLAWPMARGLARPSPASPPEPPTATPGAVASTS